MKALNDLCIKISLCNRMSRMSMIHHKDRSVQCLHHAKSSPCKFPYFLSIDMKIVVRC